VSNNIVPTEVEILRAQVNRLLTERFYHLRRLSAWERYYSSHPDAPDNDPRRVPLIKAPQWLVEQMEALAKLPSPTPEEVETQMKASAEFYTEQADLLCPKCKENTMKLHYGIERCKCGWMFQR
jgi:hypothetical protein